MLPDSIRHSIETYFSLFHEVILILEILAIEIPCLVENDVMDEFRIDPVQQGAQRQDDNSSADSTRRKSSSKTSTVKNVSREEQEQESENEDEQFQSFCDQSINIEHSFELPETTEDKTNEISENETTAEQGLISAASEASGASSEAELRIEAEPEKSNLMKTEQDEIRNTDSTRRRSKRVRTPVDRFDPTPPTPRKPRKTTAKSCPSLPATLRETGNRILSSITQSVKPTINEDWEHRPLGPPRRPRSESRSSTRTRAASLEKNAKDREYQNHSINNY